MAIKTSLREGQCPLRVTSGTGHLIGSLSDEHDKAGVALDSQSAQFLAHTHQQLWMRVQQRDRWEEVVVVVVVWVEVWVGAQFLFSAHTVSMCKHKPDGPSFS